MLSTDDAHKLHVYVRTSKGDLKKFGRVRATVFHPTDLRAVGYAIKRPDALLMVKRRDRFAALDRIDKTEQGICVVDAPDSWDEKACKRLGVDYDTCIIWENMPLRTASGHELGMVRSVVFDEHTGIIEHIDISANVADKLILGSTNIPAAHIRGYKDGAIIVDDIEDQVEESGGMAAKAGTAWAKTKHVASEETKKVTKKAGDAINSGAYKAGEAIGAMRDKVDAEKAANFLGKQVGRTKGMFAGFKEEFEKASKDE